MKIYCGIDFGLKGAITIMKNGKIDSYMAMPLTKDKKWIDEVAIFKVLLKYRKLNTHIIIEKFSGFFGYNKSGVASLMRQVGAITALIRILKIPYSEIPVKTWQKEMFIGINAKTKKKKIEGESKIIRDTKSMAYSAANKLFPNESFLATKKSKVPHDGIVDSVLLAEYGRRKNL